MPRHDTGGDVQRLIDELNRGKVESLRKHIASDFFGSAAADGPDATTVFYQLMSDLKVALPDLQLTLRDLREEGDLLRGQLTLSGTKDGPLWGTPASGRAFRWDTAVAIRPRGERFAVSFENQSVPSILATLYELDLVNAPDEMDQPLKYPTVVPDFLLKVIFTGQAADRPCEHLELIRVTEPSTDVCEACVAQGDIWPALRMCLICGFVGCCDTSKNKHMKQHYQETGHALVRSIRLDEGWIWCYPDNAFFTGRTLERYR